MQEQFLDRYSAVLAESEAVSAANAMSVAAAVYSQVTTADRFRGALGITVALRTGACGPEDRPIVGEVADVCPDAILISQGPAGQLVVLLAGIEVVTGLPAGHRPAAGIVEQRRSVGGLLRPHLGSDITVALRGRRIAAGLERVGADHVQLRTESGTALVPFGVICWVRCPGVHQL